MKKFLASLFFVGVCSSCFAQAWEQGNYERAAKEAAAKAGKTAASKDGILLKLEEGAAWRAAGHFEKSNEAFDLAEERVDYYDEQAKVKVAREAVAMMTNLSMLPYEGHTYDKIMMNTYKAVNFLMLGDYEKARVEFNRALERQREAVELNAARLEKAQGQAKGQKDAPDLERANADPQFQSGMKSAYSELDSMKAYADYVNPLTVYLDGLFFMAQSTGSSDYERSRKSLERAQAMTGENKFIQQDLEALTKAQAGQGFTPVTYILFEAGVAPVRKETRIDVPLFVAGRHVAGGKVPYAGAAFPKLEFRGREGRSLTVTGEGFAEATTLLASMDSVIAHDFKNELPVITAKTLSASAAKAGAVYGIQQGLGKFGGIGAVVGTAYQALVNKADLRTWETLPKEFHFCRIATPADRKLELSSGTQKTSVTINDGTLNLVWVKAVQQNNQLSVSQCKLK
jgi:hypothetical protein